MFGYREQLAQNPTPGAGLRFEQALCLGLNIIPFHRTGREAKRLLDETLLFLADPQHHSDSRLLNARFPYLARVEGQRHTFHLLADRCALHTFVELGHIELERPIFEDVRLRGGELRDVDCRQVTGFFHQLETSKQYRWVSYPHLHRHTRATGEPRRTPRRGNR